MNRDHPDFQALLRPLTQPGAGAVPDPEWVWLKAQARARLQAGDEATRPIRSAEIAAGILSLFAMLWLCARMAPLARALHPLVAAVAAATLIVTLLAAIVLLRLWWVEP